MFWLSFVLFFIFPVFAAEKLATIQVSASKEISDFHMGSAENLSLEKKNTVLISESIKASPGVSTSENGGPGSRTSYFIRGTEARHVSFTIDGLKVNDPSNTDRQFDAAFLTSPFLQETTIYKGPQAVLFGPDALGGLVDMRTRKGKNAPETRLQLGGGSFGTADATLSQDWQVNENRGTLTWTSLRTDGISRLNKKRFSATEKDASDMTQLTSSSAHTWDDKWHTDLLASFVRGNSELDGFTDDNSHDESSSDQYLLQQRTHHELPGHSMVSVRNGLSRHQRKLKTLSVGKNSFEGDLIQNEFLFNKERSHYKLLAGLSTEKELFDQSGFSEEAELTSVFSQTSLKSGVISLQGGLRADHHSRYRSYYTGSAGISVRPNDHTLSAQYSQGLKSPSLYQLYAEPLYGFPIGNKDLKPEKNNALEVRWSYEKEEVEIVFAWFRNNLSNLIIFTNQGYKNQSRFVAEGVEVSAGLKSQYFSLRPFLSLLEFKEEQSPVLRRPTQGLGIDASWFPEQSIEIYTQFRQNNERQDLDESGSIVKLNGYETFNVGGLLKRKKQEYGIRVQNLTNRQYEDLYGYSVMPRSLFLHYGTRF